MASRKKKGSSLLPSKGGGGEDSVDSMKKELVRVLTVQGRTCISREGGDFTFFATTTA